jgi:hypothetical protein
MSTSPQAQYEAFRNSMLANDSYWKTILAEEVQLSGPLASVTGKEMFINLNDPFFASIKDSRLIEHVVVDNQVITRIETDVHTPAGELLTLAVNEWYTFEKGLLTSLVVYFDTAAFREAMGMPLA